MLFHCLFLHRIRPILIVQIPSSLNRIFHKQINTLDIHLLCLWQILILKYIRNKYRSVRYLLTVNSIFLCLQHYIANWMSNNTLSFEIYTQLICIVGKGQILKQTVVFLHVYFRIFTIFLALWVTLNLKT